MILKILKSFFLNTVRCRYAADVGGKLQHPSNLGNLECDAGVPGTQPRLSSHCVVSY
jgi:hypothetical protein